MPMSEKDAAIHAEMLLKEIIKHQPQLFTPVVASTGHGKTYGEAIAALRMQLIEMYKTQP